MQEGIYGIYLCVFDIGHDINIIAYAVLHTNETLYQDKLRISIRDQDGHSRTVGRDRLTDVLDEPNRWTCHQAGIHEVTGSFIGPLAHDDSALWF